MSESSNLAILEQTSINRITITKSVLLKLYLLIPLVWLAVLTDKFFLNSSITKALPFSPEHFILFSLFFGTPHIVASSFSFFDSDYHSLYKVRYFDAAILLAVIIPLIHILFGLQALYMIYMLWTIIHVVGQQLSLCIIMCGVKNYIFLLYKWIGLWISVFIYLDLYTEFTQKASYAPLLHYLQLLLLIGLCVVTALYARSSKTKIGKLYIWSNYALIVSAWTFYKMQMSFFVILIPRILHDITAFIFYIAHDQNRNRDHMHNWLYKPFVSLGVPIVILCPALACTIGYLLYVTQQHLHTVTILIYISLLHYYTERFTWKNGSPHRREIVFE